MSTEIDKEMVNGFTVQDQFLTEMARLHHRVSGYSQAPGRDPILFFLADMLFLLSAQIKRGTVEVLGRL